jgi:caspase domain-containing protein
MEHSRLRRAHVALIALTLVGAVAALIRIDPGGRAAAQANGKKVSPQASAPTTSPIVPKAPTLRAPSSAQLYAPREGGHSSGSGSAVPRARFADVFPAQANATVDPAIPATNYWALLIGINDYYGGTRDNIGSYQDARDLRRHLMSLGWKGDHIVLLANRAATASMITQSIRWLASKSNASSTTVFNYSGHEEPKNYGGTRHILLHAADNRMIPDTQVAYELGRVRAAKMWINLAVCRAGGFQMPGLVKANRVVTFSSPESELSYEDPTVHHSVFGWFEIMEGMVEGRADFNDDGNVTVEEAFRYAKPRVTNRTHGMQHPFISDNYSGYFSLVPPKPAPPPAQSSPPSSDDCGFVVCGGTAQAARKD